MGLPGFLGLPLYSKSLIFLPPIFVFFFRRCIRHLQVFTISWRYNNTFSFSAKNKLYPR
jgi:hypothetical protein